jgi:hypothetical protein
MISIPYIVLVLLKNSRKVIADIKIKNGNINRNNTSMDSNINTNYNNNYISQTNTHSYKKVNLLTKKWSEACEKEFVSLDIETTGLSPENDKIIEITAIRYKNFIEIEKFSTLINPQILISSRITKINGITNDMVKDSPTIEQSIQDFYNFGEQTKKKFEIIKYCFIFTNSKGLIN